MKFTEIIAKATLEDKERRYFIGICSDWGRYCEGISHLNRVVMIKLLKYLVEERPNSNRMLDRAIGRFNRLNALKKEDLV